MNFTFSIFKTRPGVRWVFTYGGILLFTSPVCFGQLKTVTGPVQLAGGLTIAVGDTLQLATGSLPGGSFRYITEKPSLLNSEHASLRHGESGGVAIVQKLQTLPNWQAHRLYAMVRIQTLLYLVDLASALSVREVSAIKRQVVGSTRHP